MNNLISPIPSKQNHIKSLLIAFAFILSDTAFCQNTSDEVDYEKVQRYFKNGISDYSEAKYEETSKKMSYVIRNTPENDEALYYRALAKMELGNWTSAKRDLIKAIEINDQIADYHSKLGRIFYDLDKIEEAMSCLSEALALDNKDAASFYFRAACHKKMGNEVKSCEDLHKAAEMDFDKADKMIKKHCI